MRALFTDLGPHVADGALRVKLGLAATRKDTSLTISALDAANAELRGLLITLPRCDKFRFRRQRPDLAPCSVTWPAGGFSSFPGPEIGPIRTYAQTMFFLLEFFPVSLPA